MSSNEYKDYYAVLGVEKAAGINEIKKKFRKLAFKCHPDRNQGNKAAEAKFKEISEAYNVLSDEDKRAKYDRLGQYWQYNTGAAKRENTSNASTINDDRADFSQYGNFEEFIDELLGRFSTGTTNSNPNYSSQTATKNASKEGDRHLRNNGLGKDSSSITLESTIDLTYAEAFKGTTKKINLGTEIAQVRIPPGVKPGTRIRLPGKGQPNISNRSRDLYLNVKLNPHSFFSFEDGNLICEVPVTPDEAVLGSAIAIPTPDGTVNIKVPAGVSSGQVLRLRGKGWSSPQGSRTDQLVRINIAIPQQISIREKEYYEKIRDLRSENPRKNLQGINL